MSCAALGPALALDATGHRIALYNATSGGTFYSHVQVAQPFALCLASSLMTWNMQIKPNLLVKKRLANTGGRRRAHQVESGRQTEKG